MSLIQKLDMKVISKRYLKTFGVNPDDDNEWVKGDINQQEALNIPDEGAIDEMLYRQQWEGAAGEKRKMSDFKNSRRNGGKLAKMTDCPRCGHSGEMYVDLQDLQMSGEDEKWGGEGVCRKCTKALQKKYAAPSA